MNIANIEKVALMFLYRHESHNCNLQMREELEQELDIQIYPGTEIMVDVGSHHFVKSTNSSGRVLVPQPSDNKHDPLVREEACSISEHRFERLSAS